MIYIKLQMKNVSETVELLVSKLQPYLQRRFWQLVTSKWCDWQLAAN